MKARYIPLLLSLLAAVVLVIAVEGFIQRVVVEPLLQALWFVTVLLGSISQVVYWGLFILVTLYIARKSITRQRSARSQSQTPTPSNQGAVATWSAVLNQADKGGFSKWRLAQAFKKLARDVLSPDDTEYLPLDNGQSKASYAPLPPEIETYFEAPLPWSHGPSRLWHRLWDRREASDLDLDPEIVVGYLEEQIYPLAGE